MKTKFPKLIETYVQASNEKDADAYVSCFTDSATIEDDGDSVKGHHAIGEWFNEVQEKYNSTTEPLSVKESSDELIMTAKVSGSFPGSPLNFDYHMKLQAGLIQNLRIEFRK